MAIDVVADEDVDKVSGASDQPKLVNSQSSLSHDYSGSEFETVYQTNAFFGTFWNGGENTPAICLIEYLVNSTVTFQLVFILK